MKPPFVNWPTILALGGLGPLFWHDVIAKFLLRGEPSQNLPIEMVQIFLAFSIATLSIGFVLSLKSSTGALRDRLKSIVGYETWSECAVLFAAAAFLLAGIALVGGFMSGQQGRDIDAIIVPMTFLSVASLVSFAGAGVLQTNAHKASALLRWVLSVCWIFSYGGIVTLTLASLFMWLPIPVILTLAGIIAFTLVCTWISARSDRSDMNKRRVIDRVRKLALYQAGLVPLVSLGAVTFSSGQLAPIYMAIGLVTMTLGLRKISQTFAV
ncbi:MAG: hypothetical protein ACRBCJ_05555 [Hyphomicrobiaceae bacterium]